MKTKISKLNAIKLIRNSIVHEKFIIGLGRALKRDFSEHLPYLSNIVDPIFNVDIENMEQDIYDEYVRIFNDAVEMEGDDFEKMAEVAYNGFFALTLRVEEGESGVGVISLLKGKNYRIQGEFGLNT